MTEQVREVQYCHMTVKDKPGEGARVLNALKKAKVNMMAFSGFPSGSGKSQLDMVTDEIGKVQKVAKSNKWKLSPVKKALFVTGTDKMGVVSGMVDKLQEAKINITAVEAVSAGKGRYGMMIWVKPNSFTKAAKLLQAKKK